MGDLIVPPWHARKKKDKRPTTKCKNHGIVELKAICEHCFRETAQGNLSLQKALEGVPNTLREMADKITELRGERNHFASVIDEIHTVTHKQYCKKELDSPDSEGEHHSACQYITDTLQPPEEDDGTDLRPDPGPNGSPNERHEGDNPSPEAPDHSPNL